MNSAPEDNAEQDHLAKLTLTRVAREERLLTEAEGKLWIQLLPVFVLAATGLLWIVPFLRPVGAFILIFGPLVLLQVTLLNTSKRIDALLALLRDQSEPATEKDG